MLKVISGLLIRLSMISKKKVGHTIMDSYRETWFAIIILEELTDSLIIFCQ